MSEVPCRGTPVASVRVGVHGGRGGISHCLLSILFACSAWSASSLLEYMHATHAMNGGGDITDCLLFILFGLER